MSNEISLDTFPSDATQALAILYLQNQDLTNLSPKELTCKYLDVLNEIKETFAVERRSRIPNISL